jgi:hypothetical protein
MNEYEKLLKLNIEKQETLNNIKNTSQSLDMAEEQIKNKMKLKQAELEKLKIDYKNMIDKFNHIINTLIE